MRYQEPKYITNNNSVLRNKDILNVTTSSDMCIFSRPTYTMSGSTKIPCNDLTCDFSGISYTTLLDTTILNCFTNNKLSTITCLDNFSWGIKLYEDDTVAYSGTFATTTGFTTTATETQFLNQLLTGFTSLGYSFTQDDTEFTITRPFGVGELKVNIEIESNLLIGCTMTGNSICGCPTGYAFTVDTDDCISATTVASSGGASFYTASAITQSQSFGSGGARFYHEITNTELPIQLNTDQSTAKIVDAANDASPFPANNFNPLGNILSLREGVINSFWGTNLGTDGRMNNSGLWASPEPGSNEFIGFSKCIDIPTSGIYHVAMGADNYLRFRINGETIVVLERTSGSVNGIFNGWHVFPLQLNSGKNIIEMEAANYSSLAGFAAEIYSASVETLTAATTDGELGIIFTTSGLTGALYEIGDLSGYTCPSGYALDTCVTGTPVCTQISRVNFNECDFSGSCSADTTTTCTQSYNTITSGDTGVYVITGDTDITLGFNFTGDTSSFIDVNTEFKFELYEYVSGATQFRKEPVYESETYLWSDFSGTSAVTETINTSILTLDNDFLVKGHFKHDICTEFRGLLGETIDSLKNKSGDKFGLYDTPYDSFLVIVNDAQVPEFETTGQRDLLGVYNVYSLEAEDGKTIHPAPNNVDSGLIVALNGAVLAEGFDYTYTPVANSGSTITLVGPTVSGDMITYSYISNNQSTNKVKIDIYDVTTAIVSGITGGEGTEDVYFNTDSGKNELFTSIKPRDKDSIFITLNGATLANGIDYYQSITDPNRIILEGSIIMGDIITIYYPVIPNAVGLINSLEYDVAWSIEKVPTLVNGVFTLELATDELFTSIIYTIETDYIINQRDYSSILAIGGNFGDEFYYRVKNEKNYVSIKGDLISDVAYSEIIPVTLNTNANNSY